MPILSVIGLKLILILTTYNNEPGASAAQLQFCASPSPTKQTDSAILAALHRGYKPGGEYSASLYPQSPLRGQQMQCLDIVSVT